MEKNDLTNVFPQKAAKMTLKDYYKGLPDATCPKTDFLNEVQRRTGMSLSSVRNWITYGMKPNNPQHRHIVAEITGIAEEDLWRA